MGGGDKAKSRAWKLRIAFALFAALVVVGVLWFHWVYGQIEIYAHQDQAAPADAIAVLGAAEYDGHPSPVYRARLDHALDLYRRGIAPLIITMGGSGGDEYTEGAVGRHYLVSMGVPEQDIIPETHSRDTEEAARRIAVIARVNGMRTVVVVSDPTHMFRIRALCTADGVRVLTSPRPVPAADSSSLPIDRLTHEMLSYTLWRMHLH